MWVWQTNSWLVQSVWQAGTERVAVSPHVGTCVCVSATLSLSFCGKISCRLGERVNHSCEGLPSRESGPQRLRRLGLDFTSPFHSRLVLAASWKLVSWMNTYVANAHTTHSPTDRLHIPLWPRHLKKSIFKVIQVAEVNGNFFLRCFRMRSNLMFID